jgi:hypothetical protein
MASESESGAFVTRARLLDRLRERLEAAEALTLEVRDGLRSADAPAIEDATSRLETLALEFRVLEQEYRRLPEPREDSLESSLVEHSRSELEQAALRIARSAAVGSGLLERLVAVSRNLVATLSPEPGESYLPNGRAREQRFEGFRLKEMA